MSIGLQETISSGCQEGGKDGLAVVRRVAGDGRAVVRRVAEEGEASSKHTRVNGVRREKLYGQPVCAKSLMLSYICIIIILFFWFTHS